MKPDDVDIEPRHDREPPWVSADPNTTERLRTTLLNSKVSRLRDPDDPDPYTYRVLLTDSSAERLADRLEQWKHWDDDRKADERCERTQKAAVGRERRRVLVAVVWAVLAAAVAFAAVWGATWWVTQPLHPWDDGATSAVRFASLTSAMFVGGMAFFARRDR